MEYPLVRADTVNRLWECHGNHYHDVAVGVWLNISWKLLRWWWTSGGIPPLSPTHIHTGPTVTTVEPFKFLKTKNRILNGIPNSPPLQKSHWKNFACDGPILHCYHLVRSHLLHYSLVQMSHWTRQGQGAEWIISFNLPILQALYDTRSRKWASKISEDSSHPVHYVFEVFPFRKRLGALRDKTPRHAKSLSPLCFVVVVLFCFIYCVEYYLLYKLHQGKFFVWCMLG